MDKKHLKIGDKIYRPAWDEDNKPFIREEEITNLRCRADGSIKIYITNKGGFSANSIGINVYISKEEVAQEHERIKADYPNGLPMARTSYCVR